MRTLYHHTLLPECRAARIALAEKGMQFEAVEERFWQRRPDFLALNPAGWPPVLIETDGHAIAGAYSLFAYLDEAYPDPPLIVGANARARAEVRRLCAWFSEKFAVEVTANLSGEKALKRITGSGEPDSRAIRAGRENIHTHMNYISWLMNRRRWLAGEAMTLADLVAAAHLSVVDYLGDVPWEDHPEAKDWYARMKSRPSFRPILSDTVTGLPAPRHYADLDF